MCFKKFSFIILFSCFLPVEARTVLLWGTKHDLMGMQTDNSCASSFNGILDMIESGKNNALMPSNLIMTVEEKPVTYKSPRIISIEHKLLRDFIGGFIEVKLLSNYAMRVLESYDEYNPRALINFYATLYKDFLTDDSEWPKIRSIAKDLLSKASSKDKYPTILADIQSQTTAQAPSILLHFQKGEAAGWGNAREPVRKLLEEYTDFVKATLESYAEKYLKDVYDLSLSEPQSQFHGQRFSDFASPTKLFTHQYILSTQSGDDPDPLGDAVLIHWRNMFIHKNIVSLMKKKPDSPILVWFGLSHLDGIARLLSEDTNVNADDTLVLSQANDANACNINYVLQQFGENRTVASLTKLYQNTDSKEKASVIVFALNGSHIFTQKSFAAKDAASLESLIRIRLKSENAKSGIYIYQAKLGENTFTKKMVYQNP